MSTTDGDRKVNMLDELQDLVQEITTFENRVYTGMYPNEAFNNVPNVVLIHMYEDDSPPEESTTTEDEHYVYFRLAIKYRSNLANTLPTQPEIDMRAFIRLIGSVYDKLNANKGTDYWENLHIMNTNYLYNADRQFAWHNAVMVVRLRGEW